MAPHKEGSTGFAPDKDICHNRAMHTAYDNIKMEMQLILWQQCGVYCWAVFLPFLKMWAFTPRISVLIVAAVLTELLLERHCLNWRGCLASSDAGRNARVGGKCKVVAIGDERAS